jgi:SpoVK/Ycf46/Vps4 family AAA+-type ATPase
VTGLPDTDTIAEILKIHLRKRKSGIENFKEGDLVALTDAMQGFVGAEVEQVVIDARFMALKRSDLAHGNPTTEELLLAASRTKPMSQKSARAIEIMAKIAEEQGRMVDEAPEAEAPAAKRARRVLTS